MVAKWYENSSNLQPQRLSVGVVGLGLIGGSFAKALQSSRTVVGFDPDEAVRNEAREAGLEIVDSVADLVARVEVVCVSAPMAEMASVFEELSAVMRSTKKFPLVTDVASVKLAIELAAQHVLPTETSFVGGHPMAGREGNGFGESDGSLFVDAAWPLTITGSTSIRSFAEVCQLVIACGARPIPMLAANHDRLVGSISHLPHVLASALLRQVAQRDEGALMLRLAAGSFRDATRVATKNAGFVASMCYMNRVHVLDEVDQIIAGLTEFRATINKAQSADSITAYVAEPANLRREVIETNWLPVTFSVPADNPDTWRAALLDVGSSGGYIAAMHDRSNHFVVDAKLPLKS